MMTTTALSGSSPQVFGTTDTGVITHKCITDREEARKFAVRWMMPKAIISDEESIEYCEPSIYALDQMIGHIDEKKALRVPPPYGLDVGQARLILDSYKYGCTEGISPPALERIKSVTPLHPLNEPRLSLSPEEGMDWDQLSVDLDHLLQTDSLSSSSASLAVSPTGGAGYFTNTQECSRENHRITGPAHWPMGDGITNGTDGNSSVDSCTPSVNHSRKRKCPASAPQVSGVLMPKKKKNGAFNRLDSKTQHRFIMMHEEELGRIRKALSSQAIMLRNIKKDHVIREERVQYLTSLVNKLAARLDSVCGAEKGEGSVQHARPLARSDNESVQVTSQQLYLRLFSNRTSQQKERIHTSAKRESADFV